LGGPVLLRTWNKLTIHSDASRTIPGSRFYIHAADVADAMLFLLDLDSTKFKPDHTDAKCPKFNLVGKEEINNLELAQLIADTQGKGLKYEMVDFHSARPGHDLRYALSGDYMRSLGWEPKFSLTERINEVVQWTLENERWLRC
jgi:dTDP-glucose 4,6-dehydratase